MGRYRYAALKPSAAILWQRQGIVLGCLFLAYTVSLVPSTAHGKIAYVPIPVALNGGLLAGSGSILSAGSETGFAAGVRLLIVILASVNVAYTHDLFALYRGWARLRKFGQGAAADSRVCGMSAWNESAFGHTKFRGSSAAKRDHRGLTFNPA